MKIALVHHIPFKEMDYATPQHFIGIANILKKNGATVEFFVLSNRNYTSIFNGYVQHEVKGYIYPNHTTPIKAFEFASLILIDRRPLMWLMNRNNKLLEKIEEYSPEAIIIGDYVLSGMFERYKKSKNLKTAKIFPLMDSHKMINSNLDYILGINIQFRKIIRKLLEKNYIRSNLKMFHKMANIANTIVTTSEPAKLTIIRDFPQYKDKIVEISPYLIFKKNKKPKLKKHVNKILFIGTYTHGPNLEAINIIRNDIAPKLPNKEFLIAGKNCPIKKEGNIKYLGSVKHLSELLNKVDLCISPTTSGSGRKAKVFEYLASNKAILGTSIAFEGYEVKDKENVLIEDDVQKFHLRIIELDNNPKLLIKIQKNTAKLLKKYSEENISKRWIKLLNLKIRSRKTGKLTELISH